MFKKLLKSARDLDDATSPPDVPELLSQAVPDELSIDDIRNLATEIQDGSDTLTVLWAVYAGLKSDKPEIRLGDGDESRAVLEDIALRVGQMMEPVCSGASFDEDSTDYASLYRNGVLGLHIVNQLIKLSRDNIVLPARTLLSVIAYTNPDDPWTSSSCAELSRSLLSDYFHSVLPTQAVKPTVFSSTRSVRDVGAKAQPSEKTPKTERARFITEDVLTSFLRPLFAKSRPTTVTAAGRPAAFPEPPPRYTQGEGFGGGADDITVTKSWKYTRRYAVTVFEWAVGNADTDFLQQHWPLYTPILLTLLDESQPTFLKLRTLSIFRAFWSRCPDGLLSRTGLADVFEQAVFPTVLSLPSLTPEDESLALLGAAYPALFDMAGLDFTTSPLSTVGMESGTVADEDDKGTNSKEAIGKPKPQRRGFSEAQRKLLDKIVREGVMVGYHHAKEHIRLVDFLCQMLHRLVNGMGILSVKYLKDIIPMISEILTDPFGTKYPPTLLSTTRLLQAVLQTCWPRMPHYCNEITKTMMLCWLNIEDEDSFSPSEPTKAELKQQLIKTIEVLSAIMIAAKLDMSDRVSPLVAKEPQLRSLFTCCEAR
ncbi:hypothetical protein HD806DRAFT_530646 [Xylariaceae sp. AK1471]|nr:hypothetical protein HD806DRAFT_530646 [Xylariaceae sp. AK1471]